MRKITLLLATLLLLPACAPLAAAEEDLAPVPWDTELAESYHCFFSAFSGAETMAALKMMPVEVFVDAVKAGEAPLVLDIRTPGETGVLGITVPDCLVVPMDQVFTPELLGRLQGKKVVVVCQAGHRATAVALGLRHVGLKDIWILKGGTAALATQLNPKSAY